MTHTIELIAAIGTTAAACIGGGVALLEWRLDAFKGRLIAELNGIYIRSDVYNPLHQSLCDRVKKLER